MEQTQSRFKAFLARKNVNITVKTYLIDALGAMAFGLFASLLIGTIFATLGEKSGIEIFTTISDYAKSATGAALGVSIAYALKAPQLVLFSAATVGIAGNALGGPVGALVATVVATELGKIVSKETRVDILVTPGVTIISGVLIAQFVGPGVSAFMTAFGNLVKTATEMQPFFMGILVSALIGIALTLPISSAAICIMLSLDGLAGGAATAGCCAQMIGVAVLSFRENGSGTWYFDVTDGKYCEESKGVAPSNTGFYGHGTNSHDGVPSGEYSSGRRNGNLRTGRTDWNLYCHGWRIQYVDWNSDGLFRSSGSTLLGVWRDLTENGMDQGWGSEVGFIIRHPA